MRFLKKIFGSSRRTAEVSVLDAPEFSTTLFHPAAQEGDEPECFEAKPPFQKLPTMKDRIMNTIQSKCFFATRALLLVPIAAICLAGFCLTGCESDDTVAGKIADEVSDKDDKASSDLSGVWTGVSGSSHSDTVVSVKDSAGSLSGTISWSWGGTRKFSGSRSGNSVVWTTQKDRESVSDTWRMTLSSDRKRLTGSASKTDGGGYSISLSR